MYAIELSRENLTGPETSARKPVPSSIALEDPGGEFLDHHEDPGGRFEDPGRMEEDDPEEEIEEEDDEDDPKQSNNEEEFHDSDEIDIEGQYRIDRDIGDVTDAVRQNGCETLNCETNRLHQSGVQRIALAIRESSSRPTDINFADNPLGPGGGDAVSRHISAFRGATNVNFQECSLEDDGILAIVSNARQLGNWQTANFEENGMGDAGLMAFAQQGAHLHGLQTLNIAKNDFGKAGFSAFAESVDQGGFAGLKEVHVSVGHVDEEDIAILRNRGIGVRGESGVF